MQLDPIQLCGRHSRPRSQILESSTGVVDKFVTTNTDHATSGQAPQPRLWRKESHADSRARRIPGM